MKIAFKYNSQVKIYNKELKMGPIKGFIKQQFQLEKENYTLSFLDSDNDMISIVSNEDLVTLTELEQAPKLLKIIITLKEATQIIVLKEEDLESSKIQEKVQEKIQAPIQIVEKVEEVEKIEKVEEPLQEQNQCKRKKWGCQKGRWHKMHGRSQKKDGSKDKSNKRPQASSSSEKEPFQAQDQKRFEQFLGGQIGKFVEKIGPKLYKFFNKLNEPHKKHEYRGRFPFILANIFGEQPEQYKEFIQNNKDLGKQQIIKKYAQEKGIKQNDLKDLIVNFKSQKLSKWFGTAPETFKDFVQGNIDLPPKVLRDMQVEKGLQLKPKEHLDKEAKRCERKNRHCEKETKDKRSISKGEKKRVSSSAQKEEKGRILKSLIDLFGTKHIQGYYKLIEQHFSEGEEAIVQRWLTRLDQKTSA